MPSNNFFSRVTASSSLQYGVSSAVDVNNEAWYGCVANQLVTGDRKYVSPTCDRYNQNGKINFTIFFHFSYFRFCLIYDAIVWLKNYKKIVMLTH